ncbi:MAG: glycosyltransferase [Candidatus Latescibacter sp.]|nr:glycosyltransferase [Candidatus Latescibacter sp.]
MKVCTLTHTYPRFPHDINAPFVEQLMEHISRLGNEVSVLTAYDPEWNREPQDHTVDLRTYRYIWPESLHILGYSRTIEGNVRFRKRVMLLSPFLFFFAWRAFLKLVRKKKPDVLHAHWILPNGFIAGLAARATGIPLLIQLHGSDVFTAEKNPLFRRMARFAAESAAYITTPSPDLAARLGAIGVDTTKIGLVPNTVESNFSSDVTPAEAARLKEKLGIPDGCPVILAMGRMVHVKGFAYLIEAFARITEDYPRARLVLAGGGVLFEEIKAQIRQLNLENRVSLPGAVLRGEVPVYFKIADLFVVPSIRHESGAVDGLPVVIPEAMAAGLPIIASQVGGIPVLVRNGCNGILVPERDPVALAEAMRTLLGSAQLCSGYGARARSIIENSVNYDCIARYYISLYRELIYRTSAAEIPPFEILEKRIP